MAAAPYRVLPDGNLFIPTRNCTILTSGNRMRSNILKRESRESGGKFSN